ncbi:MAG: hypothetical protein LBS02_21805 [Hungatella sp.]|jgi:hypothetical protein|nr:hypothetical protein [Hungatella sp.]
MGAERKPNRGKAHYSYECGLDDTGEVKGFAGNNFKMAKSKHKVIKVKDVKI